MLLLSLRVMKGDNSIIVNLNNYGHSYQIVHKAVIKKGWKLATKQVHNCTDMLESSEDSAG